MNRLPAFSRLWSRAVPALALALCLAVLPGTGQAQTAEQRAAIVTVIESQLDAFRQNDGANAYGYAAPNIRTYFPTAEVFMEMVRGGYGFLIDPAAVEFLDIRAKNGDFNFCWERIHPSAAWKKRSVQNPLVCTMVSLCRSTLSK